MTGSDELASVRVVVADDNRRAREALSAVLESWPGLEVVGRAENGARALELARHLRPDVVVLDAIMPVLDGLEAARRIRRELPEVGLVLLTLYGSLEYEAAEAGVDVFLLKSDAVDEIAAAVLRLAGRRPPVARRVEMV